MIDMEKEIYNPGDKITVDPDTGLPISEEFVVVHETGEQYITVQNPLYGTLTLDRRVVNRVKLN